MTPRQQLLAKVPRHEIAALKKQGMSDTNIARIYGVTDGIISSYRRKHNIPAEFTVKTGKMSDEGSANAEARSELAMLCCDRGREAELYAGRRYEDVRVPPAGWFRGAPADWMSGIRRL